MELHPIPTGYFRLDGGAMFGVVPKVIWNKTNPADEQNRIDLAMRALLLIDGKRTILIDCGLGHKYSPKFADIYAVNHTETTLANSLRKHGLTENDITDVIITHWHFDHAGGVTTYNAENQLVPTFPNAHYWVQQKHLTAALSPNAREKASFFPENILPIKNSGQLKLISPSDLIHPAIELVITDGHTDAMQLPLISHKGKKLLFAADLFPTTGHIPLPYVMGYDVRPLQTLAEKEIWLNKMIQENIFLYYEHDPVTECSSIVKTEKGYKAEKKCSLAELLS
ncbi:MAG: MBL fold metallo-hydrolase [Bacteroidia bacterium]|nr:MBL fold metallo-hydrolase [Bacteroidia bacterium]